MERKVIDTINRFSLLEGKSEIIVALSGGADSMSLLYALYSLREKLGITVKATHLNHNIRGEEALRDQNFVAEQCRKLGVELFCETADVPKIAKESGQSLELAARSVRYEFLERIAGDSLIATAHTASDNLETMLFNLTRGSGLDGLCGIPVKRGIFIRPLLYATRDEVEKYCDEKNIPFVTDSTNLSDDYTRNKIRHNVIPILKELNPKAEISALKTSEILREDSALLNSLADDFLKENSEDKKLNLKDFSNLDIALKKRVIMSFVGEICSDISLEGVHISEILKVCENGGRTSLPKDMEAINNKGFLILSSKNGEKPKYKVEITENIQKINNLFLNSSIDCDKIVGQLVKRTRMSGDCMRVAGSRCTKTLNKLFNEKGILKEERDFIPVLADDKGPVWVYGLGVAARCAVTSSTKRILEIRGERI